MISILIISHSKTLAEGVKELALQMSQNKVRIEALGGIQEDGEYQIGTDPMAIMSAMESLQEYKDIFVLMDIGSAIMSAEMAKEMLPTELAAKVHLCEAPLVEGAIAAAAQAMTGAKIETITAEAKNALIGKITLLRPNDVIIQNQPQTSSNGVEVYESFDLVVPNEFGLHARPAVRLVEIISRYEVDALVSKTRQNHISAKSISQLGTLGAQKGDTLHFKISGKDTESLISALKEFQKDNFGDSADAVKSENNEPLDRIPEAVPNNNNGIIQGVAASKGIAIGKVKLLTNNVPIVTKKTISNTSQEIERLESAIKKASVQFKSTKTALQVANKEEAQIFDFHILFLEDRSIIQKVINQIENEKVNADYAWNENIEKVKKQYLNMSTSYLKERVADVNEIGEKVLIEMAGGESNDIYLKEPRILVIEELGPAQTIGLDKTKVLGIVTAKGGNTSHSAILSRSLGIPAIVNVGNAFHTINDEDEIAMDGTIGKIWIGDKHPQAIKSIRKQKEIETKRLERLLAQSQEPAITKDSKQISILANVSSPEEAKVAYKNGAEGIGLYRTEFLFMNRDTAPTEEEQYETYRAVAENMQGYPVIIRTLDVGGDKPIPYLNIGEEKNPFLGLRGARYCLKDVDLFKTQLRAICRVSAEFPIKVMFPMIGVMEEVLAIKGILRDVQLDLTKEKIPHNAKMPVGVMIEVPSVFYFIPELSRELDFVSIGTNDLTQYLLAVDRENESASKFRSALHPSVLRAIRDIIQRSDIEVGMCGELAGNPLATNLLLAFGLEKFSMNSPIIPDIKALVRRYSDAENQLLMGQFEKLETLAQVTALLKKKQPLLV